MNEPRVRIRFDERGRIYQPGETLAGDYRLEAIAADEVKAIEVSILWCTEGKGDEDMEVHDFERVSFETEPHPQPRRFGRFSTVLPNSPMTYYGTVLKIRWYVRVRAFLARGRELVGQLEFCLGSVQGAAVAEERGTRTSVNGTTSKAPADRPVIRTAIA
jgi:hypothetical protein